MDTPITSFWDDPVPSTDTTQVANVPTAPTTTQHSVATVGVPSWAALVQQVAQRCVDTEPEGQYHQPIVQDYYIEKYLTDDIAEADRKAAHKQFRATVAYLKPDNAVKEAKKQAAREKRTQQAVKVKDARKLLTEPVPDLVAHLNNPYALLHVGLPNIVEVSLRPNSLVSIRGRLHYKPTKGMGRPYDTVDIGYDIVTFQMPEGYNYAQLEQQVGAYAKWFRRKDYDEWMGSALKQLQWCYVLDHKASTAIELTWVLRTDYAHVVPVTL